MQDIVVDVSNHRATRDRTVWVTNILVGFPWESKALTLHGTFDLVSQRFTFSSDSLTTIRESAEEDKIDSDGRDEAIIIATDEISKRLKEIYKSQY